VPPLCEYEWAKVILRHNNLHENVGQKPKSDLKTKANTFYQQALVTILMMQTQTNAPSQTPNTTSILLSKFSW